MTFPCNLHWAVQNDCTDFLFIYVSVWGQELRQGNSKCFLKGKRERQKRKTDERETLEPTFFCSQKKKQPAAEHVPAHEQLSI